MRQTRVSPRLVEADALPSSGRNRRWASPRAACGHRGCWDGWAEPLATWPNLVTAVRTVLALVLAGLALTRGSVALLLASIAAYWLGDVLDGLLARQLGQETRGGALFDVLADRACSVAFWLPWAMLHPDATWPVLLYVLEFCVVDGVLSVAWLAWPLLSCNYVGRVHPLVYRLNWWPPAKLVNTTGLVLLIVVWPQPALATVFVAGVLAVKATSLALLHAALPAPPPGCAAPLP